MTEAREAAGELLQVGRMLNDPRATGSGLWLLSVIALVADSYAEAVAYSEQSMEVAVTDRSNDRWRDRRLRSAAANGGRRSTIRRNRQRCITNGYLIALSGSDGVRGVCQVLQGNIAPGIRFIKEAILQREKEGYRFFADWYRLLLAEVRNYQHRVY